MDRKPDPAALLEARRKYAQAVNETQLRMWEEQMMKMFPTYSRNLKRRKARRTGALFMSTKAMPLVHSDDYTEVTFTQQFLDYGIYVDRGTGREVPIGNPGDIGRDKVRKAKPWFSKKYFLTVMNLRDFYCENLGLQAIGMIAAALDEKNFSRTLAANRSRAYNGPGSNFTNGLSIPGVNMPL